MVLPGYSLLHEIGDGSESDESYPVERNCYDDEMFGFDMMELATHFIVYHRYRYGWLPCNRDHPGAIYLPEPHDYENPGVRVYI